MIRAAATGQRSRLNRTSAVGCSPVASGWDVQLVGVLQEGHEQLDGGIDAIFVDELNGRVHVADGSAGGGSSPARAFARVALNRAIGRGTRRSL